MRVVCALWGRQIGWGETLALLHPQREGRTVSLALSFS